MTADQRAGIISGAMGCSCIHVEKDAYSGPDWRGGRPPPHGCTYCRAVWEIRVAIQEERDACEEIAAEASERLSGGNYGGPSRCEYGCDSVIANAIQDRSK